MASDILSQKVTYYAYSPRTGEFMGTLDRTMADPMPENCCCQKPMGAGPGQFYIRFGREWIISDTAPPDPVYENQAEQTSVDESANSEESAPE